MKCSICGKEVVVINNEIIRSCEHRDSTIISQLTVVLNGKGGLK